MKPLSDDENVDNSRELASKPDAADSSKSIGVNDLVLVDNDKTDREELTYVNNGQEMRKDSSEMRQSNRDLESVVVMM